jgi:hypothetical protein
MLHQDDLLPSAVLQCMSKSTHAVARSNLPPADVAMVLQVRTERAVGIVSQHPRNNDPESHSVTLRGWIYRRVSTLLAAFLSQLDIREGCGATLSVHHDPQALLTAGARPPRQ